MIAVRGGALQVESLTFRMMLAVSFVEPISSSGCSHLRSVEIDTADSEERPGPGVGESLGEQDDQMGETRVAVEFADTQGEKLTT